MNTVQANVPKQHLATEIGTPNKLSVEYCTEVLMPIAGPQLFYQILSDFVIAYCYIIEFFVFINKVLAALAAEKDVKKEKSGWFDSAVDMVNDLTDQIKSRADKTELAFYMMTNPNPVFKRALESKILLASPLLIDSAFSKMKFDERCHFLLTALLSKHKKEHIPANITEVMNKLKEEAFKLAQTKCSHPELQILDKLPKNTIILLVQWLVAFNASKMTTSTLPKWGKELLDEIGYLPSFFNREWALRRKERLDMEFGIPTLRGPVMAEAIPPQGVHQKETYSSISNELMTMVSYSRSETSSELKGLNISPLRKSLSSLYSSGMQSLNDTFGNKGISLLQEERKSSVYAYLKELNEINENIVSSASTTVTSSTESYSIPGVDQKLACTQHRFKVVTPVTSTVSLIDAGLTWCPRIKNPFLALRRAARKAYKTAYCEFKNQYFIPKPAKPEVVYESIVFKSKDYIVEDDDGDHALNFEILVTETERKETPDLNTGVVIWRQNRSRLINDADESAIWIDNIIYEGGKICGKVHMESDSGEFNGVISVEFSGTRYTKETIDAIKAQTLKAEQYLQELISLEAQASQYARIKQREFIARHERLDSLKKILFEVLVRQSLRNCHSSERSYFKEILARCIDWNEVKIEFESRDLSTSYTSSNALSRWGLDTAFSGGLLYAEYAPDHFMNSPAVRFFLPILENAEGVFVDILKEHGSFFIHSSVEKAQTEIRNLRDRLKDKQIKLDEFDGEVIVGDHLEAVMSHHESAT